MKKILVLAEKPSVGRDLARVLHCGKMGNGYLEGEKYIVTWALGHLVTLAEPDHYDPRYGTWRIEDLPIIPFSLKLIVIKESGKQFKTVSTLMNRKDVQEIVVATDAGREGELVARWIIEKAQVKKPLKRLWISSVTDKAIREGFSKLKNGREYDNLYLSAVARAEADWLVGINATRALTCKHNAQLSCGRVQTPTLAIIARREEEIRDFRPRTYYGLAAAARGIKLVWQDSRSKETRTFDKDKIAAVYQQVLHKDGQVTEVEKTRKKSHSPQLYDLTELQRDANKYFSYSAKETLAIAQSLYENHKVLTYPRTDSRYLTSDLVGTLKERIRACGAGPYAGLASKAAQRPLTPHSSFVDDNKVTDHHAIIPTEQPVLLGAFSDKERKIYDLVVKRFFAVLFPSFEYEQTTLKVRVGDELFTARGKRVINPGWKEVYGNKYEEEELSDDEREQELPAINKGDVLKISNLSITEGKTKPPAPFTEGTLLAAMENPVKYMATEDKGLIKIIGETGGLGTVATRADIIEKLFNNFFLEKKGKDIYLTSKGRQLLELVPEGLKSPALTARWEQKLGSIARGSLSRKVFINEMKEYTQAVVKEIQNSTGTFSHDNLTRTKCPQCGKYMLEVAGKKGRMLVCQDRECGSRIGLAQTTNARCPECHKKLELRGEGDGKIFVCSCGFREKLSAFNERRSNENSKVSKRDVANYLKEQRKAGEEPLNTALADALAKLKLK